jgi:beta-1,2-mannosidase
MTTTFPLGPFQPIPSNPILTPRGDSWESTNVYNPAAIVDDGQVVLLYRAHATDRISRIGLARSDDGIHFDREPDPVLVPEHDYEGAGCEDPRITRIDETYYLTYTAYDGKQAQLSLATSSDLHTWTKHGPLFPDFNTWRALPYGPETAWSKAAVIYPEPIGGRYWMWFGEGTIHAATSTDLLRWTPVADDLHPLHSPGAAGWDSILVEIGAPPVRTDNGLLVFLTNAAGLVDGASLSGPEDLTYCSGQIAVSVNDPAALAEKTPEPWLRPTSHHETHGMVSNVTFVEGLVEFQGRWLAYYGQSDTTIGVASCPTRMSD